MDVTIAVVGTEETVTGFRLAGVTKGSVIPEGPSAKEITIEVLRELMRDEDLGIIIINQHLADLVRDDLEEIRAGKTVYPILVEVPDKGGTPEGRRDPVKDLIRRATGVEELH